MPHLVIIAIISAVFSSCMPYQYISSNQYVPLNKEKNELKVSVGLSSGPLLQSKYYSQIINTSNHIYEIINSLQIGYTLTNHLSIFSTGFNRDKWLQSTLFRDENDNSVVGNSGLKELNFGGSYYMLSNNHTFEILSAFGFGKLSYRYSDSYVINPEDFSMNAKKLNFYIQPDYGLKLNEKLEIGFFTKFLYCRYYNISSTSFNIEYIKMSEHKYFIGREFANLYFIEPGFVIREGSKTCKLQLSASIAMNLNLGEVTSEPFSLKLSLLFDFDLSPKKNSKNDVIQ